MVQFQQLLGPFRPPFPHPYPLSFPQAKPLKTKESMHYIALSRVSCGKIDTQKNLICIDFRVFPGIIPAQGYSWKRRFQGTGHE